MNKTYSVFLLAFILFSCASEKRSKKAVEEKIFPQEIPADGIALFDGNSLDGWEITNFGTQGPVRVSEGKILISMGEGCSGLTFNKDFPTLGYEIGLEARKTAGNDFFCGLTFPVGDRFCTLIVGGWSGPVVGLSTVDGFDASENETKTLMNFDRDTWYSIHLLVDDSTIVAKIDGKKAVDLNYAGHELGIRPEVSLSRPLGICTWYTSAEIRNFWYRVL